MDRLEPLAEVLGELDSEGLSLPQATTRLILEEARRQDPPLGFDTAWSMAVNRIQPSQIGPLDHDRELELQAEIEACEDPEHRSALLAERRALRVDPRLDAELREQRALLEEVRPHWRAAYEGGETTVVERAETVVSTWSRLASPVPAHYREPNGNGTTAEPSERQATSHRALSRRS